MVCLVRALAVPQNKLTSGVGERDLNIATVHLGDGWQCNLNEDKLDFRVVNPVFSGDFRPLYELRIFSTGKV